MKKRKRIGYFFLGSLALILVIGGGCVRVNKDIPPSPDGIIEVTTSDNNNVVVSGPEVIEDMLANATSPVEYSGMWAAPDLGQVISFDSSSGDNGNGMFHIDGVEGYGASGIWYILDDMLFLQTFDNATLNVRYKMPEVTGDSINLQTTDGGSVVWTKK
ncbi:MAG: hypothetical protein COX81_02560 [Candidatus Magasanikbacteria bacterium CG_4_10_14_0_2_um_filter_37_12]|uniref:Uncharacterized protein n=1 Tax=Candidatus Magasanikbacteria bacterium CG_4_10_14_0_2_um_filter_37_12 TaxID=1974637 RepID=A0A2M7V7W2_9BACT|nr:MAG: hypothetical protein COX81_02560 [Candidatus Magasanikbacteria bacterium CG_4_10_14_0_2_um_filter_37_12]